jgi:hypothetical protein
MKLVSWQSRWIWQYWINQKSYTWDDVEFVTGNGIHIENESLDHGEDICPSRQSSHRIDVLELHQHVSSHVPWIFVRVDKAVIGLMFWNFISMFLRMFLGYLELAAEEMQCSFLL